MAVSQRLIFGDCHLGDHDLFTAVVIGGHDGLLSCKRQP
jgi:hypothetical protein